MNEITTSIDMRRTGLRLQKFAKQNGYSVKDIQKYLCLSCPQPVYRWYKGSMLPSVDNLLRLSELFRVHMEELLVKEHSCNLYEEITTFKTDSQALCNRMKAYFINVAA
ncbi:MAG: helix-turn-helix domain-containing protein [Lachnospiraceae bacterium]|nr:helix-turn-helix domain-containing protein [Lachnospiraceae bacterium]